MSLINHSSSCSCGQQPATPTTTTERVIIKTEGNPDPQRFKILEVSVLGKLLAAKIRYLDAINYDGVKISVYQDITEKDLRTARFLDPHFCESKAHTSPIARFEPTDAGWCMALAFIGMWNRSSDNPWNF